MTSSFDVPFTLKQNQVLKPQYLKYGRESVDIHMLYCIKCQSQSIIAYTTFFLSLFTPSQIPRVKVTRYSDPAKVEGVPLGMHLSQLLHCVLSDHTLDLNLLLLLFFSFLSTVILYLSRCVDIACRSDVSSLVSPQTWHPQSSTDLLGSSRIQLMLLPLHYLGSVMNFI